MRVCHIGFNFFPGQGLTIFYEFARHQARQGIEVTVIAPGRPEEPEYEVLDRVIIHRVKVDSIARFSAARLEFLVKAGRLLRRMEFDLIHVYAFVGAGFLPWLSGRRRTLWLYDCQTSAIKPPLIGLQNLLIRWEAWSFDTVTVLSEGIRDIVFGRGAPVEAIVPLGADFERFRPRQPDAELRTRYGIHPEAPVLTYCGTLDHNRRMEKLIAAFAQASAQAPEAVLMIVGDGSALPDLKHQAQALGLADRVVFTGLVPYDEIPAHLSITTIALAFIVMEARFEHQPPTKTVEYLAQGLPVVATDTAGNRMFVRDGVNGVLSDDSAEGYGRALLDLIRQTGLRERLAAQARDSVARYDWANIVRERVIPVYRRLLRA